MAIRVQVPDGRVVEFPDGTSQASMQSALRQLPDASVPSPGSRANSGGMMPSHQPSGQYQGAPDLPLEPRDPLGTLAFMASSGGVGALGRGLPWMAGAALRGAAGNATFGLMNDVSQSLQHPGEMNAATNPALNLPRNIAAGAVAGPAIEGSVGAVARSVAPTLMRMAIRPSQRIQQEFGPVWDTALRERIGVGPGNAQAVASRVAQSAGEMNAAASQATQAGRTVPVSNVLVPLDNTLDKVQKMVERGIPGADDQLAALQSMRQTFLERNPSELPVDVALQTKRMMQSVSDQAYNAVQRGSSDAKLGPTVKFTQRTGQGLRRGIEDVVPEASAINSRTQALIGLQKSLEAASRRNPLVPNFWHTGTWPLVSHLMTSPEALSGWALGLTDPTFQRIASVQANVPPGLWYGALNSAFSPAASDVSDYPNRGGSATGR